MCAPSQRIKKKKHPVSSFKGLPASGPLDSHKCSPQRSGKAQGMGREEIVPVPVLAPALGTL